MVTSMVAEPAGADAGYGPHSEGAAYHRPAVTVPPEGL
jgi:hypothetical protein